jgi:hypothetical protein
VLSAPEVVFIPAIDPHQGSNPTPFVVCKVLIKQIAQRANLQRIDIFLAGESI